MAGNNFVWQSWFDAMDAHGDHSGNNDYGAAVMHPDAEFDRYKFRHSPDPPENFKAEMSLLHVGGVGMATINENSFVAFYEKLVTAFLA